MRKIAVAATLGAALLALTFIVPPFADAQLSNQDRCESAICHILITKDGFVPKTLIVKIGSTVIWKNIDSASHTVTSGSLGEIIPPFKSLLLEKGDTYEFTFEYSGFYGGTYKYFDQVTRTMRATIIVEAGSEEAEEKLTELQTIPIDFEDTKSGIQKVSLSNGKIDTIMLDPNSRSLTVTVKDTVMNGWLEVTLDRSLIDAKKKEKDTPFVVTVKKTIAISESEGFYDEIAATPTERTLKIFVPDKTEWLKISGTTAIPEFPINLMVITAVGFIGTLVVLRFKANIILR